MSFTSDLHERHRVRVLFCHVQDALASIHSRPVHTAALELSLLSRIEKAELCLAFTLRQGALQLWRCRTTSYAGVCASSRATMCSDAATVVWRFCRCSWMRATRRAAAAKTEDGKVNGSH
mmetsp:Transcript_3015/g.8308  ORF Transcript_3015/g.8308 Transcript_3015/m.8308 type:complete len:120 (-) Transcript_3015:1409-1768(-)